MHFACVLSRSTYSDVLNRIRRSFLVFFFFFNDTATTEIYTLSLHDALPICADMQKGHGNPWPLCGCATRRRAAGRCGRSEEHTSELQSHSDLVCRLLLEKKNPTDIYILPVLIRRHPRLLIRYLSVFSQCLRC